MEIIVFEKQSYYRHLKEVIEWAKESFKEELIWINEKSAMQLLNISSKTTLSDLRRGGKIRYSQPSKKIILYDRESIMDYINQHAKDTF